MNELIQPPAGLTEAEEAEWWYANRGVVEEEFVQAFAEGKVRRGPLAPPARQGPGTHIPLDAADLKKAASIAEKRGLTTEAYLANLVHAELEKEYVAADAA